MKGQRIGYVRVSSFDQNPDLSFSEGDCTILLAQTATVHMIPDLLLSVAAFTIIDYAEYSYAQK